MNDNELNEDEKNIIISIITFPVKHAFIIAMMMGFVLLEGLIFRQLWKWFIVTAFHLPQISIALASGITIMAAFLMFKGEKKKTEKIDFKYYFSQYFSIYFYMFVIGWILHFFI